MRMNTRQRRGNGARSQLPTKTIPKKIAKSMVGKSNRRVLHVSFRHARLVWLRPPDDTHPLTSNGGGQRTAWNLGGVIALALGCRWISQARTAVARKPPRHRRGLVPAASSRPLRLGRGHSGRYWRDLSSSMILGITLVTSPTTPRSAIEKIGASRSLFMAMMFLAAFI